MNIITKETVGEYTINGVWSITGSIKEDVDATTSKQYTLNVKFENVSVESVIRKSLEPIKITFANSKRLKFNEFVGGVYTVNFKAPSVSYQSLAEKLIQIGIDPETARYIEANPQMLKDAVERGKKILNAPEPVEDGLDEDEPKTKSKKVDKK